MQFKFLKELKCVREAPRMFQKGIFLNLLKQDLKMFRHVNKKQIRFRINQKMSASQKLCAGFLMILIFAVLCLIQGESSKEIILPRTCIETKDSLLCYTCLSRTMSPHFQYSSISILSQESFNFISFKKDTQLVCDQLFQLVDQNSLVEDGAFRVEELEHVHKTLFYFEGLAARFSVNKAVFDQNIQEVLIVQKTTVNNQDKYLRTLTIDSEKYQKMVLISRILMITSVSLHILLELYRHYQKLECFSTIILNLSLSIFFYFNFNSHPDKTLEQRQYLTINVLFYLTLVQDNPKVKYFIPILIYLLVLDQFWWVTGGQIFFLLQFIFSLKRKRMCPQDQIVPWNLILALIFFINKTYLSFYTEPWQIVPYFLLIWVVIFLGPVVISLLHISNQQRYRFQAMLRAMPRNQPQDESDHLFPTSQIP